MKLNKRMAITIALLFSIMLLAGCSQEKHSAKQISPLERNEIQAMSITVGNSITKDFTNKELIDTLLDHLDDIKFSKMSIKQEEEVLDKGNKFNLDSTFAIQLKKNKWDISESEIVLISEKELLLVDSESIKKPRTVLYMNQTDESTLNSVSEIYLLANQAMDQSEN